MTLEVFLFAALVPLADSQRTRVRRGFLSQQLLFEFPGATIISANEWAYAAIILAQSRELRICRMG